MRIVSLIPSGTDLVAALGLERFPYRRVARVRSLHRAGLPVLTSSIIPPASNPPKSDRCVSEALQQPDANGSLYRTNRELLRDLKPDLVLTQEICDVCAVNARSVVCDLPPGARILTLSATNFDGLWNDLRAVATTANCCAEDLIASLQARLAAVERAVAGRSRPRVLTLEWTDPPLSVGTGCRRLLNAPAAWMCSATRESCHAAQPGHEIVAADPDVVLLLTVRLHSAADHQQARALLKCSEYSGLRAVAHGQVWATDATRLFSRCTPVSVRTVEVVAGMLHRDLWSAPLESEAVHCAKQDLS
jgi:iron complex transport system substrate-binding protein